MKYTPESEIKSRIQNLQALMERTLFEGIIITHHTNLFYFSGTSQNGCLFVPRHGSPLLMIRKSFQRARKESRIENIVELRSFKDILPVIMDAGFSYIKSLGLELDIIPCNTFAFYQKIIFKGIRLKDASSLLKQVRLIKSPYEIGLLKQASRALDDTFSEVPSMIHEGMTEIMLASLIEASLRRKGSCGCSKVRAFNQDFFLGNIVSGTNCSIPSYFDGPVNGQGLSPANNPHGAGWKKIEKNEPVYVDYSCVMDGYVSDAERIFVIGKLSGELIHAHQTALLIQDEIVRMLRPGIKCGEIYELSLRAADRAGLSDSFMGFGKDKVRFVGHGVGLELDELPIFARGFDLRLEPGMTFALEPKFVFKQGAVGIENVFCLKEDGVEKLNAFKEDIIEI